MLDLGCLVAARFHDSNETIGWPAHPRKTAGPQSEQDAQAFQTITTDCHLKQPSVHQSGALVVLTMIRVLASTLAMVFHFRQVRSHARTTPPSFCQMARQIAYGFLAAAFDSS